MVKALIHALRSVFKQQESNKKLSATESLHSILEFYLLMTCFYFDVAKGSQDKTFLNISCSHSFLNGT